MPLIPQGMFQRNRAQPFVDAPEENPVNAAGSAAREEDAAAPAAPAAQAAPQPLRARALHLLLSHLRIGDEPDHRLVNVPTAENGPVVVPQAPVDQQGSDLRGRAYLEFLSTDRRLLPGLRNYIAREKVLRNPSMTDARLEALAERLRLIVAQAYHDPKLLLAIDRNALEFQGYCTDRTEFFMGQMESAVILSNLGRGELDETSLYNLGVSFCRLEELRAAVGRRTAGRIHRQNVHDYLEAQFHLQDELDLPIKNDQPHYPGQGIMTSAVIREIANEVKQRITDDDGEKVMQFMSTWEPWQAHLKTAPQHRSKYARLEENFQRMMEQALAEREDPESAMSVLTEPDFQEHANTIQAQLRSWETDFTGQLTREFLSNSRSNILIDGGTMPRYFESA